MKCSQSSLFKGNCLNLFLVEIPEKIGKAQKNTSVKKVRRGGILSRLF